MYDMCICNAHILNLIWFCYGILRYSTFFSSVRVELLNVRFAKLKQSGFMGANRSVLNKRGCVCGI